MRKSDRNSQTKNAGRQPGAIRKLDSSQTRTATLERQGSRVAPLRPELIALERFPGDDPLDGARRDAIVQTTWAHESGTWALAPLEAAMETLWEELGEPGPPSVAEANLRTAAELFEDASSACFDALADFQTARKEWRTRRQEARCG